MVLICTPQDLEENFRRLEGALEELRPLMGSAAPLPPPPLPRRPARCAGPCSPPGRVLPLEKCEGEIAACQVAPYPPGVPVIAPGEVITKKELAYLEQIGYNMKSEARIVTSL